MSRFFGYNRFANDTLCILGVLGGEKSFCAGAGFVVKNAYENTDKRNLDGCAAAAGDCFNPP